MLLGVRFRAYPTKKQQKILSQWMGCAKTIWNAKCEEEKYLATYAKKYCKVGTYAPIDQTYSQYKNKELTPYLYDCPSQILRNSTVNWYDTYNNFIQGNCGKPKRKKFGQGLTIHLTSELFRFEEDLSGNKKLFIGSKTNNIGYLDLKIHRNFQTPKSLRVKQLAGKFFVAFCYGEKEQSNLKFNQANLSWLKQKPVEFLEQYTLGIDRGIKIPVQAGNIKYDFATNQKKNKRKAEKYIKALQRSLARKDKKSARYCKTKKRLAIKHEKIANIRLDFCHKTTAKIVANPENKIIILEDLRTKNMTKRASPKIVSAATSSKPAVYGKNQRSAKAGLNRAILDVGWHQIEAFLRYKTQRAGKAFFKISAQYTSQECSACEYTHSNNRQNQAEFICQSCDYTANADYNSAMVIKKRAIKLLQHCGTQLSKKGVLTSNLDIGRGAKSKSLVADAANVSG